MSAAAPARRQFQLFESSARSSGLPRVLKQPHELSCLAASSDTLYIGDTHGCVHSLRSGWEEGPVWRPYENGRCTFILPVDQLGLFTAGEDANGLPILRSYSASATGDAPLLARSVKLSTIRHPVTCMAVSPSLSHLAVGFGNGTVILFKHVKSLFQPQQGGAQASGFGKQYLVHEGTDPVTGLGFLTRPATTDTSKERVSVLVTTTSRVIEAHIGGTFTTVDETGGAKLGCAKMALSEGKMLVAREQAIYVFGTDGKEGCYAFEGTKQALFPLSSQNVLIVSPPSRASMDSQSATIRNYAKSRPADAPVSDAAKATIFDLENKFVAFSGTYDEPIRDAWELWGSVWLLTMDGKVFQLTEQPIATSLGLMYSKNLYTLAISFAQTRGLPDTQVAEIYKRHGDHLYAKADYDGAVAAYLNTIPFVPPSHVIRKFLDAQRLSNLTSYLSELHSKGLANEDHTTLLLNCYTKLGDSEALTDFLNSSSAHGQDDDDDDDDDDEKATPPFELETAIRVLRQAHYYDHAASLADRYDAHEEYLRIQLEDQLDAESALSHLRKGKLKPEEWRRYVGVLLKMKPKETTKLVTDVCCGRLARANGGDESMNDGVPPPPKQFFAYFVDHPDEFIDFLEATLEGRYGIDVNALPAVPKEGITEAKEDVSALCNTLIEAYTSGEANDRRRRQAYKLLKSDLPYDEAQALLVCSTAHYEDGIVCLYDKMGLHEDVLRYWMDKDDSLHVVKAMREYGPSMPRLYSIGLRWLASSGTRLDQHKHDMVSLLEDIDSSASIPPIKLIQLLSKTADGKDTSASVGLVRAYLERHLTREKQEIESDTALIRSYRTESANKRKELKELDDPDAPRVLQVTRCSSCGGSLELPAVHFMCRHSYHQRCLGENEGECPNCARTHGVIREIRKANEAVAAKEDVFLAEVRESEDGYKTVSSAFGRGFMSMVKS